MCQKVGIIKQVQLLAAPPPQNLGGQKTSKIWCNLRQLSSLIANICVTMDWDIDTTRYRQGIIKQSPSGIKQKMENFGPLTKKLYTHNNMLAHPKSTLHVLHMLMHLSSSHVTLLLRKFHPTKYFPQSDLGCWADSRWALPQISSYLLWNL